MLKYFTIIFFSITCAFATVDINNATADELLELNGIGKLKSKNIVKYREVNKCFKSIDELIDVDGISKKIVSKNRDILVLGKCNKIISKDDTIGSKFTDVLLDPVNFVFVVIILVLGFIDQKTKKDLKSQIISIGVLGTFVGIFIGLQGFNPQDIINSVNNILVGLKTAFFTSIVGMSVATSLSIFQKLKGDPENK